ncbi:MAG: hypothetical protein QS748_13590 [Candidatus Endonucleobacter bathymodioli]|uniref:Uncharacterized protein n=1 Tax=Candidatus Endonucleibacter bathymodioli TaxID=539814 RepID=A0AA90NMZ9_9GAMM|nr:hypothetical protein [Candidatus Endonucleobacter bathymodioli]
MLHNAISKASIENKNVLISCSYGGGRTGSMLGCSKVSEKFKSLDDSEKSGLLYVPKTDKLSKFGGKFTHLTNSEKTTPIVAEVINELRESEKDLADGAVSIETPKQITALECWELMLRINYKVNNNPGITDDEIVELIKGGGFSSEFIEEFASCQESNIENLSAIYTLAKQIRLLKI